MNNATLEKSVIYYVGMVNSPAYCSLLGVSLYVGAAFKKMAGVVNAMNHSGMNAQLLTLPVLDNAHSPLVARKCFLSDDGLSATYLLTFRSRILRKLIGPFAFAWFALFSISRNDTVIVYNHSFEYFLLLCILRLRGVAVYQDIEDVPIASDRTFIGYVNQLFFKLTFLLTSGRKIVVSRQVASSLKLKDYLVVNGAFISNSSNSSDFESKWKDLSEGGPLCIHYGGTLTTATGLDLFIQALKILTCNYNHARPINFYVTGIGDISRVSELVASFDNPNIVVIISPKAPLSQYEQILSFCHLSLSLRSPDAPISFTTFPSKVIEASARGLALITTDVSDMRQVYDEQSAFYLSSFNPRGLSSLITSLAIKPDTIYVKSCTGRNQIMTYFSPDVVGESLKSFLRISS